MAGARCTYAGHRFDAAGRAVDDATLLLAHPSTLIADGEAIANGQNYLRLADWPAAAVAIPA